MSDDIPRAVGRLASDLVRIDSRSRLSNLAVADRIELELAGFEVERIDYLDPQGVAKRALVAARGASRAGGLAFSGHMDTVPETGWQDDPWSGRIDGDGILHGLGSADMKGPVAACILAARALPADIPITLLLTTDEETTKQGARAIVERSQLARRSVPSGIVVAEPTGLAPVRGHRASVNFTAVSTGVQAHSSTGLGRNANWAMIPFLADMAAIETRLRREPALQDSAYDPPFSDFNLILDNHGTALNTTVPIATARIKFRYSAHIDPAEIIGRVEDSAARSGLSLAIATEGKPPELADDHWLIALAKSVRGAPAQVVPYGTDASILQDIAPCVILGPGNIAVAHKPGECVRINELAAAVPVLMALATRVSAGSGASR